jgi:putative SOS response-associated peptidase YedK
MCGRYTITINPDAVQQELGLASMPEQFQPRYNAAPTQPVVVVADGEGRKAEMMRWGLIPSWAKDMEIGNRLINARSETITEKPSFRNAFNKRRCLVLADGFYEWQKNAGPKGHSQPYYFKLANNKPFAFAGLWEFWRSPEGIEIRSCTIITCEANELVKPVHERMPVMLTGEAMWDWLGGGAPGGAPGDLLALLRPYAPEAMQRYPVASLVNRPETDSPELVLPVAV